MAGNDVSFMSNQSRKSQLPHQNIKKKQKIEPYISPFILNAKKIADERAKKALKILKEGKLTPHINEWDQNTRAPGLFDPSLKKQEIFRIEPRNRSRQARENETGQSNERSPTSVASRTTNSRITMKTSASTPSRVPQGYRVNPNVVRANHPLRLSNERSRSPPQPKMSVPPPPANPPTMVSEGTDPLEGVSPRGRERRSHSPDNRKVTRSTSPIDEGIVKVLIAKEAREPPKKPTILEDILHERFRAGKGDINQQYGDIIRERLKTILNRRRRGAAAYPPRPPHSEEEQETEEEDFPHPPYYRQSRYYYPPGPTITQRKLDPNQVYTRDMMASMAMIMTAVGDILVDRNKKDYWRKSKRRSKSSPPSSSSASNYNHQNPSSTEPAQLQYDKNNESLLFPDNNRANNSMKKSARVGSSEFMKEMSAMVFQQQGGLPKSKSVVVDMIMQKLQSIENCEREIADYLKQRKTATTTSAPPPTGDEDEEEPRSLPPPSPSSSQPTKFNPSQRSLPPLSAASMENHAPKTLSNVSSPSPALTIQQMQIRNNKQAEEQMNQRDLISFFPTLHSVGCDQADAINDYTKELQYVQRLQEAVYDKKQTSMAITVDTISDVLFDRLVYAVANEVEHVIDDYASKVIQKI